MAIDIDIESDGIEDVMAQAGTANGLRMLALALRKHASLCHGAQSADVRSPRQIASHARLNALADGLDAQAAVFDFGA